MSPHARALGTSVPFAFAERGPVNRRTFSRAKWRDMKEQSAFRSERALGIWGTERFATIVCRQGDVGHKGATL
jgi:hypothetical protein